jgi:hypothetical protein
VTTADGAQVLAGSNGAPPPRWWTIAGGLLAFALAAVIAYTTLGSSGGRLAETPAPILAEGADFVATQGTGRKEQRGFVLQTPGPEGVSVLTTRLLPFRASEFSRVEWTLSSPQAPPELVFVWRTREHPQRNYTKRVPWLVSGAAPIELKADDGWTGTITGVALLVGPGLETPLTIDKLRIVAPSALASAEDLAQQWSARNRLRGYSVNYPFDAERGHDLPALPAVAIAVALAGGIYLALARWRGWLRDRRVLWGIFVGGWLLLDLRWEVNLWREAVERGMRFAGKTATEMHLAADDAPLFLLMEKIKSALPATPSRVFLYCDNDLLCARAAFMLYPQNLYRAVHRRRTLPDPGELHAGDHLLLVYSRALGYDREHRLAVWQDGKTKPADEVLLQRDALLLRVR